MERTYNFKHNTFDQYPQYDGPLGVFYSTNCTQFKIWAPSANRILLRIYSTGVENSIGEIFHMAPSHSGLWTYILNGDWQNKYYTFQVQDEQGWLNETLDPSVKVTGIDGKRGLILDMSKTDPNDWHNDSFIEIGSPVDTVLYETHIRDFSIHQSSSHTHKGKYLGVCEKKTQTIDGHSTGMDHLLELGVTHVHLLPISDFHTVSEEDPTSRYNWGYDPLHYNSPEGWYASDPWDGMARIREVKQMVQSLHKNGLGVVLDVVYNHTGLIELSTMNQTVPGYFYRQNEEGEFSNASGCGNELASERYMVRNYILHSLCYWVKEYHIDGFRFDLMGVLDIETMNLIEAKLRAINPSILLYGEGWVADNCPLPESERAVKKNTAQLNGIASFSDDFRDAVKGSSFDVKSRGFASGERLNEEVLRFGTVGATNHHQIQFGYIKSSEGAWAKHPTQAVNYVSCHDNFTLYDKIVASCPEDTYFDRKRRIQLSTALTLTAQGIPFLHSGIEFMRSKEGHHNTYKSSDILNAINWDLKSLHYDVFEYTKSVIELRKNFSVFRMRSSEEVNNKLKFSTQYRPGTLFYELRDNNKENRFGTFIICANANKESVRFSVPFSRWEVLLNENGSPKRESEEIHLTGEIEIPPIAMLVMATEQDVYELFE